METFINTVKKIYGHIYITHDQSRDVMSFENMLKYNSNLEGGDNTITYSGYDYNKRNAQYLKKKKSFNGNENELPSDYSNIIIIGGGPVGIYVSILLKTLFPEQDFYVKILEKRGGVNEGRKLERTQHVLIGKCVNNIQYNRSIKDKLKEKFRDMFQTDKYDFINFLYFLDKDFIEILKTEGAVTVNVLEYYLANYAQSIGVKIVHGVNVDTTNINSFTNDNTICVFDATGGRLFKKQFPNEKTSDSNYKSYNGSLMIKQVKNNDNFASTEIVKPDKYKKIYILKDDLYVINSTFGQSFIKEYNEESKIDNDIVVNSLLNRFEITLNLNNCDESIPFKLITGNFSPDDAVFMHNNKLIISVGDTYMKTDWRNGNGLYFGFSISYLICCELFDFLNSKSSTEKGGKRNSKRNKKMRKKRKTRKLRRKPRKKQK